MVSTTTALLYTIVLGAVIFLCRFLPFVLFKESAKTEKNQNKIKNFLEFIEATVPAVAMTVLAVNALASLSKDIITEQPSNPVALIPLAASALITSVLHVWKRNALISIFGGTALYMVLKALM